MQSSHQKTPTNEVIVGKTIEFDGVKYKVGSLLGTGYTAKVYKAELQTPSVIDDVEAFAVALKSVGKDFKKGF